jgi:1-acyl-sn-glycerol-3-phosphate acyltransferase
MRSTILYYWAKFTLWMLGWKIHGSLPPGVKKCIIIVAPHTSTWDFIIGRFAFWLLRIKVDFLIKKEAFKPVIGPLIKGCGGIPVDRSKGSSTVNQVVKLIGELDEVHIVITPEGTRTPVKNWKKGYYFIASNAGIPIVMGYMNYTTKDGGLGPVLYPSGDYEADLKLIRAFYSDKAGKHPERFILPE